MSNGGNQFAAGPITKRVELALALTGLLLIATAAKSAAAKSENPNEEFYLRERIGYFARYPASHPISNIYSDYHKNVLANSDSKLLITNVNNWRLARPSGEVCLDFLKQLQVENLLLAKPHELIIMDACLDWLFGPETQTGRDYDSKNFSKRQKAQLKQFKKDAEFKSIYENTKFRTQEISGELLEEISSYLLRLLEIHGNNADKGCHGEWLEAYNNFLEDVYMKDCDDLDECKFYGLEGGRSDSYLLMLAESTIAAGRECYGVIQAQIPHLLQAEYQRPRLREATKSMTSRFIKSASSKQQAKEQWTREMMHVLQMAQGVGKDDRVSLGEIAVKMEKIKEGDEETTRDFLERIAKYADANVDLSASAGDFNGRKRYGKMLGDLCRPFVNYEEFLNAAGGINTDDQNTQLPFDFFNIIYSLVRLSNHKDVIGISMDQFEDDVLKYHWEALYLATFACQVVYNSFGRLDSVTNKLKYRVKLNKDALDMLEMWPIEVLSSKLPLLEGPKSSFSSQSNSSKKKSLFGRKLRKYKLTPVEEDPDEAANEVRTSAAPASPTRANTGVMEEETLKLWMTIKKRFPMDMSDEWFQVYPGLVWCLPLKLRLKYMNTRTINDVLAEMRSLAQKIPVAPCTFLGTKTSDDFSDSPH